jgi:hypothetical protein
MQTQVGPTAIVSTISYLAASYFMSSGIGPFGASAALQLTKSGQRNLIWLTAGLVGAVGPFTLLVCELTRCHIQAFLALLSIPAEL